MRAAFVLLWMTSGCTFLTAGSAGPAIGYAPARGMTLGWSASTALSLGGNNAGLGTQVGFGQSYRRDEAAQPSPVTGASNGSERISYLVAGPVFTNRDVTNTAGTTRVADLGFSTGPGFGGSWSSRHDGGRVALDFPLAPTVTAGLQSNCGAPAVLAPSFSLVLGVRELYGSWEFYASPQVGFVAAMYSCLGTPNRE